MDVTDGNVAGVAGEGVEAWGTFRGNEWGNKGEAAVVEREKEIWRFTVKAIGGKEYLVERVGCTCSQPTGASSVATVNIARKES